ncbi:unnamed protein product [Clonostachys chloroleuca]|uniref:GPN-loop GTPase 1 n=1 Tax=Clonostachys chloroleuca TaxID=1926264 RepID=A0AA35MA35_9HYPO|nr:unnamed protein product [Clonostachys chloroleuca]
MVAPAVPELTEEVLHESLDARTESLSSLRELGPPDLVHLVKQGIRNQGKQIGIYHHVTGVDASSSASLAAYINTLTYREHGPNATNKIVEGVYCCYNAFSRLDMRIHVSIPGTVESYCVDERGDKRKATDELWLETYLCSVLRAYSYADDGSGETIRKIMGVRRFNPVTNTETEHRFLHSAEQLFFRGYQLGSDSVVQVPTNVSNHLTVGLLKYLETTGRYASGINLFEKLRSQSVEVSSLLAKVQFMGNEEVAGVRTLHHALTEIPMDYVMLDTQAEFLLHKAKTAPTRELKEERLRMALKCADRATIAAPSEFGTWARLAQVYVAMEDWENALTILNSCPMFSYQDKDTPIMPEPREVQLPTLAETRLDEIDSEPEGRFSDQVDPNLLGLRAASYKGTFKQAYNILTEMTAKIGWDQLLKIRSTVFVMEDEYRTEKHEASRRNPSIDGLRGTPVPTANGDDESEDDEHDETVIKMGENDSATDALRVNGGAGVEVGELERPSSAIDPGDTENGESNDDHLSKLNTKRLCERWLDSLFMVLYEDLKVYTIWRTQMAQYRAQQLQYKKSAEEWAILGSLAERLQHLDEAVEAYRACLSLRFSPKALAGILRVYKHDKNTRDMVQSVIRLVAWQYRWYSEFSPELLHTIRSLIEDEGAVKVRSIVQATSLPQTVLDLTHHYAALCATFRSSGTDAERNPEFCLLMASASASATAAPVDAASMPPAIVCIGMAGSGKTTFMRRINAYLHSKQTAPYVINLDPAVLSVPFESNIDIRDSVNYEEVMKQYNLGPNGGILTSLNLFATKVDQIVNLLEKRAVPDPEAPDRKPIENILVDTPGQIEVFVWSASGTILLESLASSFPTVIAYIIDTPRTSSTSTFMSNMLYACSILYKTKLPMILVFNKTDVKDASFAKEWMTDFEAFQEALRRDEDADLMGGGEGASGHGGSGYMGSLLNSMSLMLEEFYSHLSVVGVSSKVGTGIDEFFEAVEEKKKEFIDDYLPELQRRRQEREEARKKSRDKELDKMMQGMSVGAVAPILRNADDDDDIDVASDVEDDDDDDDDDENDPEGLQSRYQAAMGEKDDSVMADASFAKYLYKRG